MDKVTRTRGRDALRRLLRPKKRKLTQGDVRRAVGAEAGTVTKWVSGERIPGSRYQHLLEKHFGIRTEWWLEELPENGDEEEPSGIAAAS